MSSTSAFYAAWVWIVSALTIFAYGVAGAFGVQVPGVEELLLFLSNVSGWHVYVAAFVAIFLEGLYFISSFFPGSTLIIILAVLAQLNGPLNFILTIGIIFVGWCLAGVINIMAAVYWRNAITKQLHDDDFEVHDRTWTTWFPAFRANYEVAQVTEGGSPWKVWLSSVRVKAWASGAAALYALIIPLFIDVTTLKNEEGFISLGAVGLITLLVGIYKLRSYYTAIKSD